nr:uncharacterized protein LOC109023868 [Gorilla gorilla gorilla]
MASPSGSCTGWHAEIPASPAPYARTPQPFGSGWDWAPWSRGRRLSGRLGLRRSPWWGCGETQAWWAAGPEPCPAGRQLRQGEKLSAAAAGPGAKPLTAGGGGAGPAAPSAGPPSPRPPELALAFKCLPRSPGSRLRLSLHTSPQAEGAGSGLGQPRKGLPQCRGGLKGSSSTARVGAKAKEVLRASKGCEGCQHAVTS